MTPGDPLFEAGKLKHVLVASELGAGDSDRLDNGVHAGRSLRGEMAVQVDLDSVTRIGITRARPAATTW